jgi:hypothetical protein
MAHREPNAVFAQYPAADEAVEPAVRFRTTWILSSVASVRGHGHFERYVGHLSSRDREAILSATAGDWLPLETARAHYLACDALDLSTREQIDMSRGAFDRAEHWVEPMLKLIRATGATPWACYAQLGRIWQRVVQGGAVAVYRSTPQEARIEYSACELFNVPYFRLGIRTVIHCLAAPFCEHHIVDDLPRVRDAHAAFRSRWTE